MLNASTSFKLCIQLTFNFIVDLNDIGSFFADESRHDAWSSMLNSTQSYSPWLDDFRERKLNTQCKGNIELIIVNVIILLPAVRYLNMWSQDRI